jgi:hypothetical protein
MVDEAIQHVLHTGLRASGATRDLPAAARLAGSGEHSQDVEIHTRGKGCEWLGDVHL